MRKKISYLIIFFMVSMFFVGIKDISAKCYKLTMLNGEIRYANSSIASGVMTKEEVDESFCSFEVTYFQKCPSQPSTEPENDNKSLKVGSLAEITFPDNEVSCNGFSFIGWSVKVHYNDRIYDYCSNDDFGVCLDEDEQRIFNVGQTLQINFVDTINTPIKIELYAHWEPKYPFFIDDESYCKANGYAWNQDKNSDDFGYCNTDNLQYVMCGDAHDIPPQIPALVSMAVNLLKIATPIILIIVSIITLVKAIMSSREDEIKKAQQSLIRKVIAAVMVFMIISIVQFVVLKVSDDDDKNSISSCMSCFLNNRCNEIKYYKTNIGGEYYCRYVYSHFYDPVKTCDDFYKSQYEFSCTIDSLSTAKYDSSGNLKSVTIYGITYYDNITSEFSPKNKNECPTNAHTIIEIDDDNEYITIVKN